MLQLCLLPILAAAQTYLPNMAPSTYNPTTPIEKQQSSPNYYNPNQDKLPYYNPNNPSHPIEPNNPEAFGQATDGQQISGLLQNFIRALQQDQASRVYESFTTNVFRDVTSLEQFKFFLLTHLGLTKNRAIWVSGSEVQGDTAIVTLEITGLDNTTQKYDFYLMKENGQIWKVLGILTEPLPSAETVPTAKTPTPQIHRQQTQGAVGPTQVPRLEPRGEVGPLLPARR